MKWMQGFLPDGDTAVGVVKGNEFYRTRGYARLQEIIGLGQETVLDIGSATLTKPAEVIPLNAVIPAAPVDPPSVRDAMCFHDHIRNGFQVTEVDPLHHRFPAFYFSNPAGVLAATEPVPITAGTERFDYELEVAVVIGLAGTNISPQEAVQHIAGYTIFCDWSARDIQIEEMQLRLGPAKGKDGATTLGPYLVTPDELAPFVQGKGYDLAMEARINSELASVGNWSSIDWSINDVIAYVSRGTRLRTGDVIGLGTVGNGSLGEQRVQDPDGFRGFLREGDEVTLSVEQLGSIHTTVHPPLPIHRLSSGH